MHKVQGRSFEASSFTAFGHDSICTIGWLRVYLCTHKERLGYATFKKGFLILLMFGFLLARSLVLVNSSRTLIPSFVPKCACSRFGVKIVEQGRRTSSVCFAILLPILIPMRSVGFLIRIFLKTRGRKKPVPRIAFPTLRLGFHVRCIAFKARILFSSPERPCS